MQASAFPNMDKKGSKAVCREIESVLNGPMRPVAWKSTLSVDVAEEIKKIDAEVAETVAKIKASGIPFTGRIENPDNIFQSAVSDRFGKAGGK